MNPMRNVSAAVLLAAISLAPATGAFAATAATPTMANPATASTMVKPVASTMATPNVVMGTATGLEPVKTLIPTIGKWSRIRVSALAHAKTITVFDAKTLYDPADQKLVATADTAAMSELGRLHAAINADAALKARLVAANVDIDRIAHIAVKDHMGSVYLF